MAERPRPDGRRLRRTTSTKPAERGYFSIPPTLPLTSTAYDRCHCVLKTVVGSTGSEREPDVAVRSSTPRVRLILDPDPPSDVTGGCHDAVEQSMTAKTQGIASRVPRTEPDPPTTPTTV